MGINPYAFFCTTTDIYHELVHYFANIEKTQHEVLVSDKLVEVLVHSSVFDIRVKRRSFHSE